MNDTLNLLVSLAASDSAIFRGALAAVTLVGLIHFGFRTYFIPRTAPYLLRLSCAVTAILSGSVIFLSASTNYPLIFALLTSSAAMVTYIVYDLGAWYCGVDVSSCFKGPRSKVILLESLKDQKGTV